VAAARRRGWAVVARRGAVPWGAFYICPAVTAAGREVDGAPL